MSQAYTELITSLKHEFSAKLIAASETQDIIAEAEDLATKLSISGTHAVVKTEVLQELGNYVVFCHVEVTADRESFGLACITNGLYIETMRSLPGIGHEVMIKGEKTLIILIDQPRRSLPPFEVTYWRGWEKTGETFDELITRTEQMLDKQNIESIKAGRMGLAGR